MNHVLINIPANEEQQDNLIALLSDVATGFEQQDDRLLAYIEEGSVTHEELTELLMGFPYTTEVVGERNWNAEWEKNFPPVVVDDFVSVRAHFHEPIAGMQHDLLITPKMSFGTGHHATTWQVMRAMRDLELKDKRVFDFGTGTGVLAILAEKLGAASVLATDNDPWSIENARENCMRNDCTRVSVELSSEPPAEERFDVILANINRNVLLEFAGALQRIHEPGGYLLLSGLLVEDRPIVEEAYARIGYVPHRYTERNNWISLGFVNKL